MADMTKDYFADTVYGKIALSKMGDVPENFRLYSAGFLNNDHTSGIMEVKGCEFRKAKSGTYEGILSIKVECTEKIAYITKEEMEEYNDRNQNNDK